MLPLGLPFTLLNKNNKGCPLSRKKTVFQLPILYTSSIYPFRHYSIVKWSLTWCPPAFLQLSGYQPKGKEEMVASVITSPQAIVTSDLVYHSSALTVVLSPAVLYVNTRTLLLSVCRGWIQLKRMLILKHHN